MSVSEIMFSLFYWNLLKHSREREENVQATCKFSWCNCAIAHGEGHHSHTRRVHLNCAYSKNSMCYKLYSIIRCHQKNENICNLVRQLLRPFALAHLCFSTIATIAPKTTHFSSFFKRSICTPAISEPSFSTKLTRSTLFCCPCTGTNHDTPFFKNGLWIFVSCHVYKIFDFLGRKYYPNSKNFLSHIQNFVNMAQITSGCCMTDMIDVYHKTSIYNTPDFKHSFSACNWTTHKHWNIKNLKNNLSLNRVGAATCYRTNHRIQI